MQIRFNRLGLFVMMAAVLCFGILFGSVVNIAPTQVHGQDSVDEQTVLLQRLYQDTNPAVVNIRVNVPASADSSGLLPIDPSAPPATPDSTPGGATPPSSIAEGSGFVIDTAGFIVTNAHVVQDATKIEVTLSEDTTLIAQIVGIDLDSDLAVIKIDPKTVKLTALTLADSDKLNVGERAIAIGNPFGQKGTMTHGIVSGLERSLQGQRPSGSSGSYLIPQVIQTDAAINPGNSGGPLLNNKGEVIGVNTAIESRFGQSSGVGFAVPSNIVKKIANKLIKDGKVDHSYLGIAGGTLTLDLNQLAGLDDNFHGVLVQSVSAGSPAAKAGIKASTVRKQLEGANVLVGGDIIVGVDDVKVNRFEDLLGYLFVNTEPGQKVTVKIYRDGQTVDVSVELGSRPTSN
ncbi:MAG: trypsin-like peptidase domain-containing protein [Chloroflexota bacterium]